MLVETLGQRAVYPAVERDDAAECRHGVAGECPVIGVADVVCDGNAAGVVVLDDRAGGQLELVQQAPGRVQVEHVVERERPPMTLGHP